MGATRIWVGSNASASDAPFDKYLRDQDDEFSKACRTLSFLVLFWFLHASAWMNVLSYDIFRKFTRFRRIAREQVSMQLENAGYFS